MHCHQWHRSRNLPAGSAGSPSIKSPWVLGLVEGTMRHQDLQPSEAISSPPCKVMMRVPVRDKRPHREGLSSPGWDGRTTTNWRGQTDDNLPWLRNQKWHRGRVRCLQAKRSLTLEQYSGVDCPNQGVELSILPNDVSRLLRVEPFQQLKFVSPDTSISRCANCIYTVSNPRKAQNNFPQQFSASRQKAKKKKYAGVWRMEYGGSGCLCSGGSRG